MKRLAAVLLLIAAPAAAATPGVGLPIPESTPAGYRANWCPQLKPPTPDQFVAPPDAVAAGWDWRTRCPARGWSGWFAEEYQRTTIALRNGWETDRWGTRGTHDGQYTLREFEWAEVFWPQCSDEYRALWWERAHAGGSAENPEVLTTARGNERMIAAAMARGAWPARGETAAIDGFAPWAECGWTYYLRNEIPESEGPTVPPPVPPTTPPTQPPTTPPTTPPAECAKPCAAMPAIPAIPPDLFSLLAEAQKWRVVGAVKRGRMKRAEAQLRAVEDGLELLLEWQSGVESTGRCEVEVRP